MNGQGPTESVSRAARLYRCGVLCPAELWNQVADHLVPDDVRPVLDGLPEDLRLVLRTAYGERPGSLRPVDQDDEVRQAVSLVSSRTVVMFRVSATVNDGDPHDVAGSADDRGLPR